MNKSIDDIIIFEPCFCNRAGTFQIAQAKSKLNNNYLFTMWTFFPRIFDFSKESSNHYRFLANAVQGSARAKETFKLFDYITLEELPYTDGFYFPIITNDDKAIEFMTTDVFGKTYNGEKYNE